MFESGNIIWAVVLSGGGLVLALILFEFDKVIWGAFLSVFALTAAAFGAMCLFVIGSHVGWVDTAPGWGEVFTLVSIFIASVTALGAWRHQVNARKRTALSNSIILYFELERATKDIIGAVHALTSAPTTTPAIHFGELEAPRSGTQFDETSPAVWEVLVHSKNFYSCANFIVEGRVSTQESSTQVSALFEYSTKLGTVFLQAFHQYQAFLTLNFEYAGKEMEEAVRNRMVNFAKDPASEKYSFYSWVEKAADSIQLFEDFRQQIPTPLKRSNDFDDLMKKIRIKLRDQKILQYADTSEIEMTDEAYESTLAAIQKFAGEQRKIYELELQNELLRLSNNT